MKTLVIDFETSFALMGIPFFEKELPFCEVTGLVARHIGEDVYAKYADLPIYEKNLSLEGLINYQAKSGYSVKLQEYLLRYEEQIHYHINRYFDTGYVFDYSMVRQKLIYYVVDILETTKAEMLYYGITPHDPLSYVLYLAAHFYKLEVLMVSKCHALNSYQLYSEIGSHMEFVRQGPQESDPEVIAYKHEHVKKSLLKTIASEPSYMTKQKKDGGSFVKKVKNALFVKKRVSLSGWQRYKKKRDQKNAYESQVSIRSVDELKSMKDKIIYFPLHFQPELTTSPDGGLFSQQWSAIKAVADHFKDGYCILVKEHPSQFMINSKHVRTEKFYDGLRSIGSNVKLGSLSLPSDQIQKVAAGVATITGTVGFESLMNEKPVLFFGDAKYNTVTGAFRYLKKGDIELFADYVDGVKTIKQKEVIEDFQKLSESLFYFSYEPDESHVTRHLNAIKFLVSEHHAFKTNSSSQPN